MKKTVIAAALIAGLSTGAYAQGTIEVGNQNNTSTSPTAISNGLLFTTGPGGVVSLEQGNVSIEMFAGTVGQPVSSLTPIVTILGSANGGDGDGGGQFTDFSANFIYNLSSAGVGAGATAEIELEIWEGSATTFLAAGNSGANVGSALFDNATGGGSTPPTTLTGMPGIVLAPLTPEPTTIILGGLGAAALLAFRRRK
jgi:hypothetical protein